MSICGPLARSACEAHGFLLCSGRFLGKRNRYDVTANLDFQWLRQKGKLAANHDLKHRVLRLACWNRLPLELEQVIDGNRNRLHSARKMPAGRYVGDVFFGLPMDG